MPPPPGGPNPGSKPLKKAATFDEEPEARRQSGEDGGEFEPKQLKKSKTDLVKHHSRRAKTAVGVVGGEDAVELVMEGFHGLGGAL